MSKKSKKNKFMKEIRYRIFSFFYFFNTKIVFAKSKKESKQFIKRYEDGPQMS